MTLKAELVQAQDVAKGDVLLTVIGEVINADLIVDVWTHEGQLVLATEDDSHQHTYSYGRDELVSVIKGWSS